MVNERQTRRKKNESQSSSQNSTVCFPASLPTHHLSRTATTVRAHTYTHFLRLLLLMILAIILYSLTALFTDLFFTHTSFPFYHYYHYHSSIVCYCYKLHTIRFKIYLFIIFRKQKIRSIIMIEILQNTVVVIYFCLGMAWFLNVNEENILVQLYRILLDRRAT